MEKGEKSKHGEDRLSRRIKISEQEKGLFKIISTTEKKITEVFLCELLTS